MKKLISFAVAGMFALSLAACGSSSSAAASSTESSAESTAASTADSAAADSDLAYIQSNGKMVIGYTVYEPMNYTDAERQLHRFRHRAGHRRLREAGR